MTGSSQVAFGERLPGESFYIILRMCTSVYVVRIAALYKMFEVFFFSLWVVHDWQIKRQSDVQLWQNTAAASVS